MQKKINLLFLLNLLFPLAILAYDAQIDGIYYNFTAFDKTATVTYLGKYSFQNNTAYSGDVVIPKTVVYNGATYTVTTIGENAFIGCSGLTSVIMPESLTTINGNSFQECSGLKSIYIPRGVTFIQLSAFLNCSGIESIVVDNNNAKYDSRNNCNAIVETNNNRLIIGCKNTVIPNSITTIEGSAFYGCSGLTSITIPTKVTNISNLAFSGCSGLESITVAAGNTNYDSRDGCNAIIETSSKKLVVGCKNTVIPSSVTGIGDFAFYQNSGLTSIEIPENITSIGKNAFDLCTSLTAITIPSSITTIGDGAFVQCKNLTSLILNNNTITSASSPLTSIFGTQIETCVLGSEVTNIGSGVFSGFTSLKTFTIPSGVTFLGSYAFRNCTSLTSVIVEGSPENTSTSPFTGCTKLSEVTFDCENVHAMFCGLTSLKKVTFTDKVKSINSGAFASCSGLTSIVFPAGLTSIGSGAFQRCSGLTSINIPAEINSINASTFANCTGLISVAIPDGVTNINVNAFSGCSALQSVIMGIGVQKIATSAFYGCSSLNKVVIRDLSAWCNIKFENLHSNPLYYAHHMYDNNDVEITELILPEGITTIGDYTFSGWTGLKSIVIPSTVTSIGKAFEECTNLTSVTINSNDLVSVNRSVSSKTDTSLTAVFGAQVTHLTLGEGVSEIGNYAFYKSNGLISVTLPSQLKSIGSYTFYGCGNLEAVHLPDNMTKIYSTSFNGATDIYVKRGTMTLLALWIANLTPYDENTNSKLPATSLSVTSRTQTTATIKVTNLYSEYETLYDLQPLTKNELALTGLFPERSYTVRLYISLNGLTFTPYVTFNTLYLNTNILTSSVTASSITITGTYTVGDADVTSQSITLNGQTEECNTLHVTGLNPNSSYNATYSIVVTLNGQNCTYTKTAKVSTSSLQLTTQQPKVISVGNIIVAATSNLDDEETNVGFEWRRTDWTDDFASNNGKAYLYEGMMEGYIRNLYAEKLWKYRPYYKSDTGTSYYGDWVGIDPTNTSYFEPTVHTYNAIDLTPYSVRLMGLALPGSENVIEQGFEYWKDSEIKNAPLRRTRNGHMTVTASGIQMTAPVEGLEPNTVYRYCSYAKTLEGFTYGEEKTFTTPKDNSYIPGDVNGDGDVDIADAVCIVNHVVGKPNVAFFEDAADVNNDGDVDIADAVRIINLVVGKISALSR